ncbi:hypothetical protein WH47_07366 [Habropoda laboriosa]|uniref:Uncharacterized protein n=1 Tax=Habropoda laboriosa TaxID=597456 RepID=A0A0L7R5Y1_9HYME|nr:hypothetical protein WH47_07366 [Habropoda laboriosa]
MDRSAEMQPTHAKLLKGQGPTVPLQYTKGPLVSICVQPISLSGSLQTKKRGSVLSTLLNALLYRKEDSQPPPKQSEKKDTTDPRQSKRDSDRIRDRIEACLCSLSVLTLRLPLRLAPRVISSSDRANTTLAFSTGDTSEESRGACPDTACPLGGPAAPSD